MDHFRYRNSLNSVLRRVGIGVIGGYRTASTVAVQVLAGIPPVDLLVRERVELNDLGRLYKNEIRNRLFLDWQTRWDTYEGWAKVFVGNVQNFCERKWGEINYYSAQMLTGHGIFCSYLFKIRKKDTPTCWFCKEEDTPEHTLYYCI